jgi:hypothetical protein
MQSIFRKSCPPLDPEIGVLPHRAITRLKPQNLHFSPRMHPQGAISLFGPLWGGVAENAGLMRFLPLWAISPFGPLWLFLEDY